MPRSTALLPAPHAPGRPLVPVLPVAMTRREETTGLTSR